MKKRVLFSLIAVTAVGVTVATYFRTSGDAAAPQFTTAAATRGNVVETVEATGTLGAVMTVQVGTQVSGTIESLFADFNSHVKKGQVIARLDPSLLQAQVDQAEATVVRLEAEVDRARVSVEDTQIKLRRSRELFENQLIPRTDLETAESAARQAEASLKAAQAQVTQSRGSLNQNRVNLSHTIIRAPVDGIVISRNVDVGQTVAASMSAPTLFVLANDLTAMQVSASIDESDIGRIKTGQRVTFKVDAYPTETFTGRVSQVRLQPVVAQNVVSYTTIIDVPNPELKLKPGMTANVTVEIARADDVIRVPSAALRFRPSPEVLALFGQARPSGEARPSAGPSVTSDGRDGEARPSAGPSVSSDSRGGEPRPSAGPSVSSDSRDRETRPPAGPSFSSDSRGEAATRGQRIWILREGNLRPIRVQAGISDGSFSAITSGDLVENEQVVTGMAIASTSTTTTTTSPLMPRRPGQGSGRQTGSGTRPGASR